MCKENANVRSSEEEKGAVSRNFIEQIIDKDLAEGVCDEVCTRNKPRGPPGY
ncbi:MAG: hypothetical protein K2P30_04595 [Lachnospiraceae bacterium]|nr:hypothetical protein [Lachnospiraceae bacterium]